MIYLLSSFLLIATANIQMGSESTDVNSQFGTTIMKASIRLQKVAETRPFKLKGWNDSILHTAETARLLATNGEASLTEDAIKKAKLSYSKNNFIFLLQAVFVNTQGRTDLANQLFEEFLLKSQTYSEFEEAFISWREYHKLRRIIYELLVYRGVSFEDREEEIQVRIPYEAFFKHILSPKRSDFGLNLLFIVMIFGGALLLIFAHMSGIDFSRSLGGSLIVFYFFVWVAYGLWIIDLAFGLPFGLTRFTVVAVLLPAAAVILTMLEIRNYHSEQNQPLEAGYIRCQKCRKVILKLSVECPNCHIAVQLEE